MGQPFRVSQAVAVVLWVSCSLVGSGCGREASDEIVVGEFGSLTGAQATFGQTTHEGIALAIKHLNESGGINGRKIKHVWYDNRSSQQETKTVVRRLIDSDRVVALLGEVASGQSLVAAPLAQQAGIPMISPSSTNPEVTKKGNMIFRVCFIDPDQGYVIARFAHDTLKAGRVATLYDQAQPYSVGLRDNFRQAITKLGGTVTVEQAYSSGASDYSAQLHSILASKPDAVFVPGYYNEVARIAIQARAAGLTVPMLGCDGWENPELDKLSEGKLEGCYYSNHYAPEDQRPESRKFVNDYKEAYGKEPGALAALGYDAAMILADAMKRSPSLAGADLAKVIAATKNFKGVTGTITLNRERNALKPAVILQMKNGKPVYRQTILPPEMDAPGTAPAR